MGKRKAQPGRQTENASAFARRLGVNRSTICRAIQSGRLICDDRGLLDVQINLERWAQTASGKRPDVAQRHQNARSDEDRAKHEAALAIRAARDRAEHAIDPLDLDQDRARDPVDQDMTIDDDEVGGAIAIEPGTLAWYGAQKIRAQNRLVLLGMALRAHRSYPLDGIEREAAALGGILRSAFDRLVDQTAPRLAIERSAEGRRAMIEAEIAEVRRIFRREFPRALRRLRMGPSP